jgi:hypothetical protein
MQRLSIFYVRGSPLLRLLLCTYPGSVIDHDNIVACRSAASCWRRGAAKFAHGDTFGDMCSEVATALNRPRAAAAARARLARRRASIARRILFYSAAEALSWGICRMTCRHFKGLMVKNFILKV